METHEPIIQQGKRLPQYIAALSVCLGSLAAGAVLGWTGNISEEMKSQSYQGIPIDDESLGWIGSTATLGAAFGCIPIGKLCDLIGRKSAMLFLTIPFMIGWILILFPQSLLMIYIGRFLTGMAGCAFCVSAPIYTSEIAEKEIRGTLGSYFELFLALGILLSYIVAVFASMTVYTILMATLPILFALAFIFQPESPVYTIKINKEVKAESALIRLRGSKYDFHPEILDIKKALLEDNQFQTSLKDTLRKKATKKSFLICFGLMFIQQAGGICAVTFYGDTIFESAGSTLDPKVATIIVGLMQVVSTFISSIIVDKLGRRILLITSNAVVTLACTALAVYFTIKERSMVSQETLTSLGLLPVISLSCYMIFFSLGIGPIVWIIPSEVFPQEIKGLGTGLASTFNWLVGFCVSKFYLDLENAFGSDVTFYLFSIISFSGTLFVYFIVPETKGKSLNQIQNELNR